MAAPFTTAIGSGAAALTVVHTHQSTGAQPSATQRNFPVLFESTGRFLRAKRSED
ncbi:MAG: hypothetical protein IT378_24740 [Sandaracinaceae bacterium]|nr:hypothetical protein [Sandaracinaceae bacterium]